MSVLFIVQTAVLFVFALGCFGGVFSVRLTADDLLEGEGVIEYSENGDGIGVYGETNAGAYYEILYTDYYTLRPGAYDITVDYSIVRDETLPEASQPVALGTVELRGGRKSFMLWDGEIYLVDWRDSQTQRLWVTFPHRAENVELAVKYHATGDLFITGVTIRELPVWRFSRLLSWLALFLLMDGFIWFFFIRTKQNKIDRLSVMAGILCVGFSSLLAVNSKLVFSDDLLHHLGRFIHMSNSLFAGQIPVRIHMDGINGFGNVTPLFYPELFLILPAVLYRMAFPVQVCYQIYVVTVNAATYLIAYTCFKRINRQKPVATVGACLYILAAYRIACLYERSAVGEYTAMAFLPLIAYGLWNIYTAKDDARFSVAVYAPLVLGLSGVIQSNIPTIVMSAVMILLTCLILLPKTLKPKRLLALFKVVFWVLAINLWFLLPLVDSLSMPIQENASSTPMILGNRAVEPVYLLGGLSQGYQTFHSILKDAFPFGLSLVIGLAVFLAAACRREQWKLTQEPGYHAAKYTFLLALVTLWMAGIYFPWDWLSSIGGTFLYYFCYVQFPWRYLSYASLFAAVTVVLVLAAMIRQNQRQWVRIISVTLLAVGVMTAGTMMAMEPARLTYQSYYSDLPQNTVDYHSFTFAPRGSDFDDVLNGLRTPQPDNMMLDRYGVEGGDYMVTVRDAGEDALVEIPRYRYDNYHAYDQESGEEFALQTSDSQTVMVEIPAAYEGTVVLRYVPPVLWRIAEIISLLSAVFCLVLYRKSKRPKETA